MPDVEFALGHDFPPVTYDDWRAAAEADLNGASVEQKLVTKTYEGIEIRPLYTRLDALSAAEQSGLPGLPPFVRGARALGCAAEGWDLRCEQAHPDRAASNQAILTDLAGGATSITLRWDRAARQGLDAAEPAAADLVADDGIVANCLDDLDQVLAEVQLSQARVALEAGAWFLPAAAALVALAERRQVPRALLPAEFGADPLGTLAREGSLPCSAAAALAQLGELALWTARHCPRATAVAVDTGPYHDAGATAAQDIAYAAATGVEYLRAMVAAGLSVDDAAKQTTFRFSIGTHHFLAIAKLRAARRVWGRVIEASGGSDAAGGMRMHAQTSRRVLTQRDPYVNLLRNTVALFAAGLGGAASITPIPFDAPSGVPDAFSRRVARNTLLVLQEEAHLHRVVDPAGGSWFLDRLTQQLAEKAWTIFQSLERAGGMLAAMQSGAVAAQIDEAFAPRAQDIARRKEGITGVSEFPDVHEQPVAHVPLDRSKLRESAIQQAKARRRRPAAAAVSEGPDRVASAAAAAAAGASLAELARGWGLGQETFRVAALARRSFAEPFEELRDASDAWQAAHGRRPTVFLANLGSAAHFTARATYAKNFFEAGGFDVVASGPLRDAAAAAEAFAASGATVAVICSSDKLYPEWVPPLAAALKQTGARSVVLAGNPGPNEAAWRAAGVDRFIFIKCDVLATLREMLREEGVLNA